MAWALLTRGCNETHASIADEQLTPRPSRDERLSPSRASPSGSLTDMRTITFIDEDSSVREAALPTLMDRFPDHAMHACSDGAEAWERIQQAPPDLAIFDLCLPSIDGLDLFLRIKNFAPGMPVILTSTNRFVLQNLERKFSADGLLQTIVKPIHSDQLVERAIAALYGKPLSTLRDLSLASVLQMLALEGKNCWLDVSTTASRGACRLLRGEIVYAACGGRKGIDAVQAMMRFSAPLFLVFPGDDTPPAKRNVFASLNELLLLCCSAFDEEMQVA